MRIREGQVPSFFDVRGQIAHLPPDLPTSHPPLEGWVGDESSGIDLSKFEENHFRREAIITEAEDKLNGPTIIEPDSIESFEQRIFIDRLRKGPVTVRIQHLEATKRALESDDLGEEMSPLKRHPRINYDE